MIRELRRVYFIGSILKAYALEGCRDVALGVIFESESQRLEVSNPMN